MKTMSTTAPLDIATLPQLAVRAVHRVDLSKLTMRRNIASTRRGSWRYQGVVADNAIVKLTAAVALLDELLADDDLEESETRTIADCKNQLAARLESAGGERREL